MPVEVGMALVPGPLKGNISGWLNELDHVLPELEGHIHALWMPDHFFWDDVPTYEAMTVLTFLAARFPAFHVGSSVLAQSYRNPAYLAKMGATLQTLSGGRFILGIGAGWKEDEYHAYNYLYPSAKIRLDELEESLQIIKLMWEAPGPVSFTGKHYQIQDAYCEPHPEPVPLIMVGGGGKTTMRHAAAYADWWNISDTPFEKFVERMNILKEHCAVLGRDFGTIRKTWFGRLVLGKTEAEALERARTQGRSHYTRWTVEGAMVGTPEQVIDKLRPFVEIGVDYFMFEILDVGNPEIRRMALDDVIAPLKQMNQLTG